MRGFGFLSSIWNWSGQHKGKILATGLGGGALVGTDVVANAENGLFGGALNKFMRTISFNQADVAVDTGFFKFGEIVKWIGELLEKYTGNTTLSRGVKNFANFLQDKDSDNDSADPTSPNGTGPSSPTYGSAWKNDFNNLLTHNADGSVSMNYYGLGTAAGNAVTGFAHGAVSGAVWLGGSIVDVGTTLTNAVGLTDVETDVSDWATSKVTDGFKAVSEATGIDIMPDLENSGIARTFNIAGGLVGGGGPIVGALRATRLGGSFSRATAAVDVGTTGPWGAPPPTPAWRVPTIRPQMP